MNQKGLPNTEYLELYGRDTAVAFEGSILVSTPDVIESHTNVLAITVGSTGCDNDCQKLSTGDYILYDAGKKGKFEVRLLTICPSGVYKASLSVTKLE